MAFGRHYWPILFEFCIHLAQKLFRNLTIGMSFVFDLQHRVFTIYLSFRQISSFGSSSTIRQFTHNVADMKKLAAHDFEDILQVTYVVLSIPVLLLMPRLVCFSVVSLALKD